MFFKGPLADAADAVKNANFNGALQSATTIAAGRSISFPHPTALVETHCWSSEITDMDNMLFFADAAGSNRWILIQRENLIDAVITEDQCWQTANNVPIEDIQRRFQQGGYDHNWSQKKSFGGYVLSSTRPYHFFYDQLINLSQLAGTNASIAFNYTNQSFLRAGHVDGDIRGSLANDDSYYLYPTILGATTRKHSQASLFYKSARDLEARLLKAVPSARKRAPFTIWVAVVGQKRSWLEQIPGLAEIINRLSQKFGDIHVLVDGLTAPYGVMKRYPEEDFIFDEIRSRLSSNITIQSLIGDDYISKIALCQTADIAITDAGTGSTVPARICGIPTILHGSDKTDAFRNDDAPNLRSVWINNVVEAEHPNYQRGDFTSYHVHWQAIFNAMRDVSPEIRDKFVPVEQPPNKFEVSDFEAIGELTAELRDSERLPDFLIFISKFFEKKKDPHTALAVAIQAAIQRQGRSRDAIHLVNKLKRML